MFKFLANLKVIAGIIAVAVVLLGIQQIRISSLKVDVANAQVAVADAQAANTTNLSAIEELKAANKAFEEKVNAGKDAFDNLELAAKAIREKAARTERELADRRRRDTESPPCAALLDQSLAVCPDVVRRLRERETAIRPN